MSQNLFFKSTTEQNKMFANLMVISGFRRGRGGFPACSAPLARLASVELPVLPWDRPTYPPNRSAPALQVPHKPRLFAQTHQLVLNRKVFCPILELFSQHLTKV